MERDSSKHLNGKTLFVSDQISCSSSRINVQKYQDFILHHGATLTKQMGAADILLVDTCAYNQINEKKSLDMIGVSQNGAKEGAKVIVCGCLAGISPQKIQEAFKVEFFSPNSEKNLSKILGINTEDDVYLSPYDPRSGFIGSGKIAGDSRYKMGIILARTAHRMNRFLPLDRIPVLNRMLRGSQSFNPNAYAVQVSQGCLGNCSFCVIPLAKGKTRSLSLGLIVEKIQTAVVNGAKDIVLVSEDTGAYGKDIGITAVELLDRIHAIPGKFNLYIHWFDPRWLRPYEEDLIRIFKLGRVKYLQLPIQSASNTVLNRMKRAYTMDQVLPILSRIRQECPQVTLGTQIIAGFPGETAEEFEATRKIVREGWFPRVDVFEYSNRPGSSAARMEAQLSSEVISARAERLRKDWRQSIFRFTVQASSKPSLSTFQT